MELQKAKAIAEELKALLEPPEVISASGFGPLEGGNYEI